MGATSFWNNLPAPPQNTQPSSPLSTLLLSVYLCSVSAFCAFTYTTPTADDRGDTAVENASTPTESFRTTADT